MKEIKYNGAFYERCSFYDDFKDNVSKNGPIEIHYGHLFEDGKEYFVLVDWKEVTE